MPFTAAWSLCKSFHNSSLITCSSYFALGSSLQLYWSAYVRAMVVGNTYWRYSQFMCMKDSLLFVGFVTIIGKRKNILSFISTSTLLIYLPIHSLCQLLARNVSLGCHHCPNFRPFLLTGFFSLNARQVFRSKHSDAILELSSNQLQLSSITQRSMGVHPVRPYL